MTKPLLFALIAVLIVLTACEQSDENGFIDPSPRIKTITSRDMEGTMITTSFEYDSMERIVKKVTSPTSYEKYQYLADSLIVVNRYVKGTMTGFDSLWLNEQGLVIKKIGRDWPAGSTPVTTYTIATTYKYNAEGYLVKFNPGNHTYEVEDGNTFREILYSSNYGFPWPDRDTTAVERVVFTFSYEFIPNSINTIGNENMGMAFWGKQDKNLAYAWKSVTFASPFDRESKGNIAYQLDAHQRVFKKISDKSLQPYIVYTYY